MAEVILEDLFSGLSLYNINKIKFEDVYKEVNIKNHSNRYRFSKILIEIPHSTRRSFEVFQDIKEVLERCELNYVIDSGVNMIKYYEDQDVDVIMVPNENESIDCPDIKCYFLFTKPIYVISESVFGLFTDSEPIRFLQDTLRYRETISFKSLANNIYLFSKI